MTKKKREKKYLAIRANIFESDDELRYARIPSVKTTRPGDQISPGHCPKMEAKQFYEALEGRRNPDFSS